MIKVNPNLIALGACHGIVDPWLAARTASDVFIVVFIFIALGLPLICLQCECICLDERPKEMKKDREKLEMTSL
jgi:hypothetical protein